jgi:hypothetical protein
MDITSLTSFNPQPPRQTVAEALPEKLDLFSLPG